MTKFVKDLVFFKVVQIFLVWMNPGIMVISASPMTCLNLFVYVKDLFIEIINVVI